MSDKQPVVYKSGISFFGALTLIFITLKLCGVIDWWWIWVLAPTWIPMLIGLIICGLALVFLALVFVVGFIIAILKK